MVKGIGYYTGIPLYGENYADGFGVIYGAGSDLGYALYLIAATIGGRKYGDTALTWVARSLTQRGFVQLFPNYPNPSNGQTTIGYSIPEGGNVDVSVYDMLGRRVSRLVEAFQAAGFHSVLFEPKNLSSGVCFAVLRMGTNTLIQKILCLQ